MRFPNPRKAISLSALILVLVLQPGCGGKASSTSGSSLLGQLTSALQSKLAAAGLSSSAASTIANSASSSASSSAVTNRNALYSRRSIRSLHDDAATLLTIGPSFAGGAVKALGDASVGAPDDATKNDQCAECFSLLVCRPVTCHGPTNPCPCNLPYRNGIKPEVRKDSKKLEIAVGGVVVPGEFLGQSDRNKLCRENT